MREPIIASPIYLLPSFPCRWEVKGHAWSQVAGPMVIFGDYCPACLMV